MYMCVPMPRSSFYHVWPRAFSIIHNYSNMGPMEGILNTISFISLLFLPVKSTQQSKWNGIRERRLPLLSMLHVFWISLCSYFFYILSKNTSEEMQTWPAAKHILQFSMQLSKILGLSPSLKNTWKTAV